MLNVCYLLLGIAAFLLILYFFFELHYFFRALLCLISGRFFKKRCHILDETTIKGVCLSNDVDSLLDHMNNARYVRELDFAKIDFYERTGLYSKLVAKGGSLFAGATTIRYRRFIKIFTKYRITTQVIYWDNQNIFIEHRFITNRSFVNAIALCRIRLVNVDADEFMKDMMLNLPKQVADVEPARKQKPTMPPELEKWMESNQISSLRLREMDKIENSVEVCNV
ncbi:protein THEM6 [Dendroctonus ponderosae]